MSKDGISFRMTGFKELEDAFNKLKKDMMKAKKAALMAAIKVARQKLLTNILPFSRSRSLYRSIGVKVVVRPDGKTGYAYAGVKNKFATTVVDGRSRIVGRKGSVSSSAKLKIPNKYAMVLEKGKYGHKAKHYRQQAYRQAVNQMIAVYKSVILQHLRR